MLTAARVRERVRGTILERIGDTPLVPLRRVTDGTRGEILAKLESFNPAGSLKDRAALWMTIAAEEDGSARGKTLLDATSGNTGVALALVGAVLDHRVELVMPDKVSIERKRMAAAYGATITLSDPLEGSDGAIRVARRMAEAEPRRYAYLDQYSNPANPLAHELTTGPEIWEQTQGGVTHVVAGVGTSGTIVGLSAALRAKGVRVVAAQPAEPFHGIDGWKHMATALRPAIWDEDAADVHLMIPTEPALDMARRLAREEGIFAGPSGGAAVLAALRVAQSEPGRIVVIIADGGERYLSTPLWE
jgi:S-sulfo-L-cysteine synthase (O-acetyl-L-serine-dependent)